MAECRLMTHHGQLLRRIQKQISELQAKNALGLVVFDLDSTLFDVSLRLERVLLNFAKVPAHQSRFPEQIQYFKNIQILKKDWGIRQILVRAGLEGHHNEFQDCVREYWIKHFFSNEALEHDIPYPGAPEFVQSLAAAGAEIIYLTGRDVHRMGEGSKKFLLHWGFPLDEKNQQLILKPHRSLVDAKFKKDWFGSLPKDKYQKIWFFENEPVNIHLIRKKHPEVEIIFFDSTHSGEASTPDDLPRILHFLLDEQEEKI